MSLQTADYRRLAEFRYLLRRFLAFSEAAATRAGLTARHHQALLAIKGAPAGVQPTVGFLAERLLIQHHSAVELVNRLVAAGVATRTQDPQDRRRMCLTLTQAGESVLGALSADHLAELRRLGPALRDILGQTENSSVDSTTATSSSRSSTSGS